MLIVLLLVFVFWSFPQFAEGYPIEDYSGIGLDQANNLSRSINETVRSLLQIDLLKLYATDLHPAVAKNTAGLNLINFDSFSKQDAVGIFKAVTILFLQIVITALGVLLGILKVALEFLTSWR